MMRRGIAAIALLMTLLLAGCGIVPNPPSEEAKLLPDKLKSLDVGIVQAWASLNLSGFRYSLSVTFTVDGDAFTADQLKKVIETTVETVGEDAEVTALKIIADQEDAPKHCGRDCLIDLQGPAEELGFEGPHHGNAGIDLLWSEVIDTMKEW